MEKPFLNDPQSERGTACPRNFLGLTNFTTLSLIESVYARKRGVELEGRGVTGHFDDAHLRYIHHYLFQDVFPWAGSYRVVDISKGTSNFGRAMYIASALQECFEKLRRERFLSDLSTDRFTERAAYYLGEINAIHPFREGNGRTQRELIRQVTLSAGHPLSWSGFSQAEMVDASIASHLRGDNEPLARILRAGLLSSRSRDTQ